MKLAYRVFYVTLITLTLAFLVSAQTTTDDSKRPESDPRNTAPTVGTGGPVGGPTGLFTVYDGQTLRKGEFTFSAAYSNFDRDPGDVDISEVPVSFQIGLTNYLELFFNTDAFRGVKTNSPRNLSSYYLPNANCFSCPAIVLAPNGLLGGAFAGQAVFRPAGNQPFVAYPYIGGGAGHFGYPAGPFPPGSGNPTLGVAAGGATNNFPGIGSIYGSILPGVVLSTVALPAGPIGGANRVGPDVFATAPSYLNDAPFLGREYGTSSFSTYSVGAKWRFTNVNNPIGVGIIPFYRFYNDTANSAGGFNQLQGGASPGSSRGDFGLVGFVDARVRKWMNISANVGYIYNGDVKADFPGGEVTLLDRGDELLGAIGVDFPVNKYFQPIAEIRSVQYVGGRTYNAFENNPVDGIIGARVFIRRWVGFGAAYRHHFNAQDRGSFDDEDSFTSNVVIPCTGTTVPCTPQVVTRTFSGLPTGFRPSSDPHGFILQGWIGRRNERLAEVINEKPVINSVDVSDTEIKRPCPEGTVPAEGETCDDDGRITVRVNASDPENDPLTYNYTVSGGRIEGTGESITWDLSNAPEGEYTITATIDDGCGVCAEPKQAKVTVAKCICVEPPCNCGDLSVTGPPSTVDPGDPMTFTASVSGGDEENIQYSWNVTIDGEDANDRIQGSSSSSSITVDTTGLRETTVRAEVTTSSNCPDCGKTESETGVVGGVEEPRIFDEFGPIKNNDVRTRVDLFFVELQNNPDAQGYIINYGSSRQVAARERLIRDQARLRNFPLDRIVFVNGGVESQIRTRLWIVPAGADPSSVNE